MDYVADRTSLAVLGREWLLHGHLQDRLGMALVMEHVGREEMQQVAIEEWMAASPIYSRRMQRALNFIGDGVDTIMKNLQLDIGAPHEFMDFRYTLIDRQHGEFWLAHCGALMDVEPMGEDFVHGMCHTIEDPTFDATAGATNPFAQVRPLHRPPRVPPGRMPHCHWRIDVVADDQQVVPHPNQLILEQSIAAGLAVEEFAPSGDSGGLADYSGDFDPDFRLDDLSYDAMRVAVSEFALQSHLLLRSLLLSVTQRFGAGVAESMLPRLVGGWGGLTAQRLREAFDLPRDAAGLAAMLDLHPFFSPRSYIGCLVETNGQDEVRLAFSDCPAGREAEPLGWFSGLGGKVEPGLEQLVQAFEPRAKLDPIRPRDGELHAYRVRIDPFAEPAAESAELAIAKISTGARFRFGARGQGTLRSPALPV